MKRFIQFIMLLMLTVSLTFATVTVTPATGGTGINASDTTVATLLTGPILSEGVTAEMKTGTVILNAPTGFRFDLTGTSPTAVKSGTSSQFTVVFTSRTAFTITATITKVSGGSNKGGITFGNIRVKPISTTDYVSGNITKTGISAFPSNVANYGTLTVTTVLPVEIVSFINMVRGNKVELRWNTATEVNSSAFEVEKNVGGTWSKIGSVPAAGTTNAPQSYSYSDVSNTNASYRLKMVDRDGSFEYSIETFATILPSSFYVSQNYPNPFNPTTNIRISMNTRDNVVLTVFDITGKEIATLVNGILEVGMHDYTFDASQLSAGVYFYKVQSANKITTQKMTLLK